MTYKSEKMKAFRKTSKRRIIESMGNACQICGYDKCDEALDLHHIDPTKKELSFGAIRASNVRWELIVEELRKCILLCANCHREVHYNNLQIPENYKTFNEDFADYKSTKYKQEYDACPICNKDKLSHHSYCSHKCSQQSKRKLDWDSIDLEVLLKELKTRVAVAEHLGVSDKTIGKRLKASTN